MLAEPVDDGIVELCPLCDVHILGQLGNHWLRWRASCLVLRFLLISTPAIPELLQGAREEQYLFLASSEVRT